MFLQEAAEGTEMVAYSETVKARCMVGRTLGPAERAAVIRKLECEALSWCVVRDQMECDLRSAHYQIAEVRLRLELAREADRELKEVGR